MAVTIEEELWVRGLGALGQLGLGDKANRLESTRVKAEKVLNLNSTCLYELPHELVRTSSRVFTRPHELSHELPHASKSCLMSVYSTP